ncbi:MAG: YeeE/YedE thiosulfate transporter family protein [Chthoniobacterales bacterium]
MISLLALTTGTDPLSYAGPAWSPYVVGALIGVLSWLTFLFSDKAIGASSAYANVAGAIGRLVSRRHTDSLDYFKNNPPKSNWELTLVIGVLIGSFIAAWTGHEMTDEWLPPMWQARFGADSYILRMIAASAGGLLMAFGARLGGGCTSGHGISGTLQLSVGSWIAVICFFLGGIPVAMLLYGI